jgi:Na+-transporting methylmalonyl-CoA/oxaloacetate decarboxylase gamma subunit
MSTTRYTSAGGLVLGVLVCFALGISSFVRSGQDASMAATQRTATAQVTKTNRTRIDSSGHSQSTLSCDYRFTVDGVLFAGSGCPVLDPNESIRQRLLDGLTGAHQFSATVYYDPNDPSTNSLTEFAARSGYDNKMGILLIGLGIILLVLVALGMLMSNNQNTSVPARAAAPDAPAPVPEGSSPGEQQFLEDLDHSLRSAENPDHSSTN